MKRLTTLALLAGMLSAPALHSEEPGSGSAAPLSFPQLNDAADSARGISISAPDTASTRCSVRASSTGTPSRIRRGERSIAPNSG